MTKCDFVHKFNKLDIKECKRDCRCKICDKNVNGEDIVYIKSFRLNAQPFHICLDCWKNINDLVCSYKNESMLTAQKSQNSNNNEIFNARSKDANIIKPNPNKKFVPPPTKPKTTEIVASELANELAKAGLRYEAMAGDFSKDGRVLKSQIRNEFNELIKRGI